MLYKIEIENFLSFRERQILDLTVGPGVTEDEDRFAPLFAGSVDRAPKVVAFYGANASGKTTVLKAVEFITAFVQHVRELPMLRYQIAPFADKECAQKPISFAIEYGGPTDLIYDSSGEHTKSETRGLLRYEVAFRVEDGLVMGVEREALRQRALGKGRWERIFERTPDGEVKGSDFFKVTHFRHLQETLNPMASVLASYAFFQHPSARTYSVMTSHVLESNLPKIWRPDETKSMLERLWLSPELLSELNDNLSRVDVGVEDMRIEQVSGGFLTTFKHTGLDLRLIWDSESQGTKAFVRLFPILSGVLDTGGLALIDEFDTLLHPLLLPEILRWMHDPVKNEREGQLWLTCHSATLLEDLVKEEVVIVEKDRAGRSSMFSLMDVKSTRRDDNLYKKYLGGAYGGIPVIG